MMKNTVNIIYANLVLSFVSGTPMFTVTLTESPPLVKTLVKNEDSGCGNFDRRVLHVKPFDSTK